MSFGCLHARGGNIDDDDDDGVWYVPHTTGCCGGVVIVLWTEKEWYLRKKRCNKSVKQINKLK